MISKLSITTAVAMAKSATSVFRGEGIPDPAMAKVKSGHHSVQTYDNADVCLTCTRKHCDGGEACFSARRKQMRRNTSVEK